MMMAIMPSWDMSRERRSRGSLTRKRGSEPEKGGRAGAFLEDEEYSENDEIARQMRLERMRAIR